MTARQPRRVAPLLVAVLLSVLLAACSISSDGAPHDVPADKRSELETAGPVEPSGGVTAGDDRIFLIGPDGKLRTVFRLSNGTAVGRISSLLEGPNPDDQARGLTTALPEDLVLNSVSPGGNIVAIDLGPQITQLPAADLVPAIGQLVYTASQLNPEAEVVITVDGVAREWPNGSGVQHSGALTIYDFFGLAESSQPDFPEP
jgi:hypothetical protein